MSVFAGAWCGVGPEGGCLCLVRGMGGGGERGVLVGRYRSGLLMKHKIFATLNCAARRGMRTLFLSPRSLTGPLQLHPWPDAPPFPTPPPPLLAHPLAQARLRLDEAYATGCSLNGDVAIEGS
jgi:hypothetical protein